MLYTSFHSSKLPIHIKVICIFFFNLGVYAFNCFCEMCHNGFFKNPDQHPGNGLNLSQTVPSFYSLVFIQSGHVDRITEADVHPEGSGR